MGIRERLAADMKVAMKDRDQLRLSTIRLVRSEIKNAEISKGEPLSDDEVTGVLARELKKRRESIALFEQGGRAELAEKEGREADVVKGYLPEQLDEDEVRALVDAAIAETGATRIQEMGKVMGALMPKIKGRADGTVISSIVKERLGAS